MSVALVDNDVLYKTSVYGLAHSLIETKPRGASEFHALGAARFMISKRITKRPPVRGAEAALREFEALLGKLGVLEPTQEEVVLAAELEYLAGQAGQSLDGGESLLCAILITRAWDLVFTGDKRAITAVSMLLPQQVCKPLAGRLVCLEQLFLHLLSVADPVAVRAAVCSERHADRALTSCFACHSEVAATEGFFEGLDSYVRALRAAAPGVLSDD